ncbi:MAG: hypothetical protein ACREQI_09655 [Candidatus Binataceae bacterium]
MPQPRIKGSFIYLANAVSDLRGNWIVLATALAPMVLAAALCLLPDALNLQARLAGAFGAGAKSVGISEVRPIRLRSEQIPVEGSRRRADDANAPQSAARPADDDDSGGGTAPPAALQPYPDWLTSILHFALLVPAVLVTLLTLCVLERIQAGRRESGVGTETIAIYERATALAPAFLWVSFLQLAVPLAAFAAFEYTHAYAALILLIAVGAPVYLWLYFAQYALVFGGLHSFHALLASRDVMRKRFFRVTIRIVVFLAVWSGYNSWAAGTFVIVSLLAGPLGAVTGTLAATVFAVGFAALAVSSATTAFFTAAGLRLYQDLLPDPARQPSAAPAGRVNA